MASPISASLTVDLLSHFPYLLAHRASNGHFPIATWLGSLGPQFCILSRGIGLDQLDLGGFHQLRAGWTGSLGQLRLPSSSVTTGGKQFLGSVGVGRPLKLAF